MKKDSYKNFIIPDDLMKALSASPGVISPEDKKELYELCFGTSGGAVHIVGYTVPGNGYIQEAEVVRCKNGSSVNFTEEYMRRRDPNCMYIGDDFPTDKPKFKDVWNMEFPELRAATMKWLSESS